VVKATQALERLEAPFSVWGEAGSFVFTTESGTAVDPGTHSGRSVPRPRLWAWAVAACTRWGTRHALARVRRATAYRHGANWALLRRGHRGRVRPRLHCGRALRRL